MFPVRKHNTLLHFSVEVSQNLYNFDDWNDSIISVVWNFFYVFVYANVFACLFLNFSKVSFIEQQFISAAQNSSFPPDTNSLSSSQLRWWHASISSNSPYWGSQLSLNIEQCKQKGAEHAALGVSHGQYCISGGDATINPNICGFM